MGFLGGDLRAAAQKNSCTPAGVPNRHCQARSRLIPINCCEERGPRDPEGGAGCRLLVVAVDGIPWRLEVDVFSPEG